MTHSPIQHDPTDCPACAMSGQARYAKVYRFTWCGAQEEVEAYLPPRYKVTGTATDDSDTPVLIIAGFDHAGWTLDGYIIPRLGSGWITAEEITRQEAEKMGVPVYPE